MRTVGAVMALGLVLAAQGRSAAADFAPLAAWEGAVRAGDGSRIAGFYSTQPLPTLIVSTGVIQDVPREAKFWAGFAKSRGFQMDVELIADRAVNPRVHQVGFEAGIHLQGARGPESFFAFVQQTWLREPAGWRIISGGRSDLSRLQQPTALTEAIYSKSANAAADIAAALRQAQAGHKRVLLDFGGNWCYDCHVLDMAFRRSDLAPLLAANYVLVNVDVENFDYNLDLVKRLGLSLDQGVPMLAVLGSGGQVLGSSQDGSFQAARALGPEDIIRFLSTWKAQP